MAIIPGTQSDKAAAQLSSARSMTVAVYRSYLWLLL